MYILIDAVSKRNMNSATPIKKNTVYYLNPPQKEDCFTKNIISNTEERNSSPDCGMCVYVCVYTVVILWDLQTLMPKYDQKDLIFS